ncbi:hypothetical protein, partial [Bacillus cereus]|uniref:hypothetical protein n=1 Tax=Bacillus cereus TaxID=1396 RepID=UPI0026F2ABD8
GASDVEAPFCLAGRREATDHSCRWSWIDLKAETARYFNNQKDQLHHASRSFFLIKNHKMSVLLLHLEVESHH